jgi:HEAT repeat protein
MRQQPALVAPPQRAPVELKPTAKAAALQEISTAINSHDEIIRAHAVEAARDSLGSAARNDILRALGDKTAIVRFAACMAAGELRLEQARPFLIQLVTDQDPSVEIGAIFALHRIGDVRYSSGLEEALRSPQADVRANAVFALGRLGERSAIRILRPVLKDSAVEVRLQAAEALWRLGDDEGLKFLVAASLSQHPAHQMVGILALAGPRDNRVIEHVRAGLDSDYVEVKLVTARALGMLGSDEAFVLAMDGTRSTESRQRYLASLALGAIGRSDAQDALVPLLKDADPDVRVAAAAAILQLQV